MQGVGIGMRLIYLLKCVFGDLVSNGWGYMSMFCHVFLRKQVIFCDVFGGAASKEAIKPSNRGIFECVSEKVYLPNSCF